MDVVKLPPGAEVARNGRPLSRVLRIVRGPDALRRWAVVSLVMNIAIVVTGGLWDENTIDDLDYVAPKSSSLEDVGSEFTHTFPPYSLTVLRVE